MKFLSNLITIILICEGGVLAGEEINVNSTYREQVLISLVCICIKFRFHNS